MAISYHFVTATIRHYRQGDQPWIGGEELETGYWCRPNGKEVDPLSVLDIKEDYEEGCEFFNIDFPEEVFHIQIEGAGNTADYNFQSAIDFQQDEAEEKYFIQPHAKTLILLAQEFWRTDPDWLSEQSEQDPEIDKDGEHARILTLWRYDEYYNSWGEFNSTEEILGLLVPCSTGSQLVSVEKIRATTTKTHSS
jgi:hypothetical protein